MERQKRLFDLFLSNLTDKGDLTNQVLEVVLSADGSVELSAIQCRLHRRRASRQDWKEAVLEDVSNK